MKLVQVAQSFIFFLVVGFFVLVPQSKVSASYIDPPAFPNFPTVDNMSNPQYDGRLDLYMTGEMMIYAGKETKYFFAVKFHTDDPNKITFIQDRHNLDYYSYEVILNNKVSPFTGVPYPYYDLVVYVYYEGAWEHFYSKTVNFVTGEHFSEIDTAMGCNSTSYDGALCISGAYRLQDVVKSSEVMYWGNNYNPAGTPSNYDNYPATASGEIFPTGLLYHNMSQGEYSPSLPYYIIYRVGTPSTDVLALESAERCTVDPFTPSGLVQPFACSGDWHLYNLAPNGEKVVITSGDYYPPWLSTSNAPNTYCDNIVKSNYNLMTPTGSALCKATAPKYVDDLIPGYQDPIDTEAIELENWGIGEWFKTPFLWFVDIVNSIAEWFYSIYYNFMLFITPDPDMFSWYFGTIKTEFEKKFQDVDLSSLEAFKNIGASDMPNIQVTLFGVTSTILDFKYLKDNIGILRPIAIASVGLFLLLFNINQINKLLTDTEVTA